MTTMNDASQEKMSSTNDEDSSSSNSLIGISTTTSMDSATPKHDFPIPQWAQINNSSSMDNDTPRENALLIQEDTTMKPRTMNTSKQSDGKNFSSVNGSNNPTKHKRGEEAKLMNNYTKYDILVLANRMRKELVEKNKIKDRKYRLRTYKKCFLHSYALTWLMNNIQTFDKEKSDNNQDPIKVSKRDSQTTIVTTNTSPTNENNSIVSGKEQQKLNLKVAEQIGNKMIDFGYISHVTYAHKFKARKINQLLFFRFYNDVIDRELEDLENSSSNARQIIVIKSTVSMESEEDEEVDDDVYDNTNCSSNINDDSKTETVTPAMDKNPGSSSSASTSTTEEEGEEGENDGNNNNNNNKQECNCFLKRMSSRVKEQKQKLKPKKIQKQIETNQTMSSRHNNDTDQLERKWNDDVTSMKTTISLLSETCLSMSEVIDDTHSKIIFLEEVLIFLFSSGGLILLSILVIGDGTSVITVIPGGQEQYQSQPITSTTTVFIRVLSFFLVLLLFIVLLINRVIRKSPSSMSKRNAAKNLLNRLATGNIDEKFPVMSSKDMIDVGEDDDVSRMTYIDKDERSNNDMPITLLPKPLETVTRSISRRLSSHADTNKNNVSPLSSFILRQQDTLPPVNTWPHRPVLMTLNTNVSPKLQVTNPNYKQDGPLPIGVPFPFESELFKGVALIRIKDVPCDDDDISDSCSLNSYINNDYSSEGYFRGKQRKLQCIIQGQFKEEVNVSDVLTGHEFDKPFRKLPPSWILNAGVSLISRIAPGMEVDLTSDQPKLLSCLAATIQVLSIDMPGNEPNICSHNIKEDCTVFGGAFSNAGNSKNRNYRITSSSSRKKFLSSPSNAKEYTYDTQSVYTFDFYQHLLDLSTYSLDIGVTKLSVSYPLNGQPIQFMAKTKDNRYLWSFLGWHESLLNNEQQ